MPGTCGRDRSSSSEITARNASWESRLTDRLPLNGLPERKLTWSPLGTPSSAERWWHTQQVSRIDAGDSSGLRDWPTPTCRDAKDGDCRMSLSEKKLNPKGHLGRVVFGSLSADTMVRDDVSVVLNPVFCLGLMGFPEEYMYSIPNCDNWHQVQSVVHEAAGSLLSKGQVTPL